MGANTSWLPYPPSEFCTDLSGQGLTIAHKLKGAKQIQFLNLADNQIIKIPRKLPRLLILILAKNNISVIPPEISQRLTNYASIETLDLSYNQLSSIPNSILQIPTLKNLTAFHNKITDIDFSNTQLVNIDLGMNQLTKFPNISRSILNLVLDQNDIHVFEPTVPNLPLILLSMARNHLTSFSSHFTFSTMSTLDLSDNDLEELPSLNKMSVRLRQLDVSNNKLRNIPLLPRGITEVNFRNNRITELPESLSANLHITSADFSMNQISKVNCVFSRELEKIFLFSNKISQTPESDCQELRLLFMMNNNLSEIPPIKSNFIHQFYFRFNHLSVLNEIDFNPENTEGIDFAYNDLTEIPEFLFHFPNIEHVYLNHNKFTFIPLSTFQESPLIYLNLSGNLLKPPKSQQESQGSEKSQNSENTDGESQVSEKPTVSGDSASSGKGTALPSILPPELEELYLDHCGLTELPKSLSNLHELSVLNVSRNQLTEIPDLPYVQRLYASMNQLTAVPHLPESMEVLDLSFNGFDVLPPIPQVSFLDISYNKLQINKERFRAAYPNCKRCEIKGNTILSLKHSLPDQEAPLSNEPEPKVVSAQWKGHRQIDFDPVFVSCQKKNAKFCFAEYDSFSLKNVMHLSNQPEIPADLSTFSYKGGAVKLKKTKISCATKGAVIFSAPIGHSSEKGKAPEKIDFICGKRRNNFEMGCWGNPQMSPEQGKGEELVYEDSLKVEISMPEIPSWLVLCSQCVIEMLHDEELQEIVCESTKASELAYGMKNAVIASGCSDNFTIFVTRIVQ